MPYLYIKQENEAERLYTFWLIVTALVFRRVGFLHRLGTQRKRTPFFPRSLG